MDPQPGDVLVVDHQASVQFSGRRQLVLRVISVSQRPTYQGWAWLTGYVLDRSDNAVGRREVFVRLAGLRHRTPGPAQGDRRG
jgi:hypothetical protein